MATFWDLRDFLHEIIERRTRGKPTRGRRRIQMLHKLANGDGYVTLKRAAEDREVWRKRKDVKNLLYRYSRVSSEQTTDDDKINCCTFHMLRYLLTKQSACMCLSCNHHVTIISFMLWPFSCCLYRCLFFFSQNYK